MPNLMQLFTLNRLFSLISKKKQQGINEVTVKFEETCLNEGNQNLRLNDTISLIFYSNTKYQTSLIEFE